jgi:hypothetical protein
MRSEFDSTGSRNAANPGIAPKGGRKKENGGRTNSYINACWVVG